MITNNFCNVLDTKLVKNRKLSFIAWDIITDIKDRHETKG